MRKLKLNISLFAFVALFFANCSQTDLVQPGTKIDLDKLALDLAGNEDFLKFKNAGDELSKRRITWFYELSTESKKEYLIAYSSNMNEEKQNFRNLFKKDEKRRNLWKQFVSSVPPLLIKFVELKQLSEKDFVMVVEKALGLCSEKQTTRSRTEIDCLEDVYRPCTNSAMAWAGRAITTCYNVSSEVPSQAIDQCVTDAEEGFDGWMDGCEAGYQGCMF
jgi:hypothetical protein